MSTILRALRRLERDKTRQIQRPLREEVATSPESPRRLPVALLVAGFFAVGVGLGAAALLIWPQRLAETPAPVRPAQDVAAPAPPPAAQSPSTPRPELPLAVASPPPAPPTGIATPAAEPALEVAAVPPAPAPAPLERSAEPAAALAEPPPEPAAAPQPRAGRTLPEAALSSEVAVVRRIEPPPLEIRPQELDEPRPPGPGELRPGAEALKPRPRQTARAPAPEPAPPPPQAVEAPARSAVPVILVARTQWHPQPERREALLEVETPAGPEAWRVREGDNVGPLIVNRIEPSSVIFLYEDVELRHAVGGD